MFVEYNLFQIYISEAVQWNIQIFFSTNFCGLYWWSIWYILHSSSVTSPLMTLQLDLLDGGCAQRKANSLPVWSIILYLDVALGSNLYHTVCMFFASY